jgi:NTP pyrophosphatase (non-canonical NTP hydrolase)
MNNITHPELVRALVKPGELMVAEATPVNMHLLHMAVGVCGEAGELIDAVKKAAIYQKQLDINNIIEELGDLEFYMEGLRQSLGLTREQCLQANIDKLSIRYNGIKYSDKAAQQRADKV